MSGIQTRLCFGFIQRQKDNEREIALREQSTFGVIICNHCMERMFYELEWKGRNVRILRDEAEAEVA